MDWPTQSIKFITPFAAGGPTDLQARPVADHLSKVFGQPVLIENRPGGGMTIAATMVVRSKPDGYTLLFGTNSVFSLAPIINANAQYTSDSLQPIIKVASSPMVLVASNASGFKSMADVIEAARKNLGAYSFASVGAMSTVHLFGEWFNQQAGIKLTHVPYRGSAPALNDLIAGHVPLFIDAASSSLPLHNAKKVRIIAVFDRERLQQLPDVQTSGEAGYPQMVGSFWAGLAAPAQTPRPIIDKIFHEVHNFVTTDENFKDLMARLAMTAGKGSPEEFKAQIEEETARWKSVADKAGFKPN